MWHHRHVSENQKSGEDSRKDKRRKDKRRKDKRRKERRRKQDTMAEEKDLHENKKESSGVKMEEKWREELRQAERESRATNVQRDKLLLLFLSFVNPTYFLFIFGSALI
jgi:hypothetical protein